jgi:hypothetical protein
VHSNSSTEKSLSILVLEIDHGQGWIFLNKSQSTLSEEMFPQGTLFYNLRLNYTIKKFSNNKLVSIINIEPKTVAKPGCPIVNP